MSATRNRGFSGAAELPIKQSSDCRSRKDVGELSERKPRPYTKRRRACHVRHAHWRNRPAGATYDNTYRLTHLFRHIREGRAKPTYLKVFSHLEPKRAEVLAWVVTCCLVRTSFAVLGTAWRWGLLVGCHHNTARRMLRELCEDGWLVRTPMFVRKKCVGRRGQKLFHWERCSWYGPSPTLRLCFQAYKAGRDAFICEARRAEIKVRPIQKTIGLAATEDDALASHGDPPILGKKHDLLTQARAYAGPRAVADGPCGALKESPRAATVVEGSPEATHGAEGALKESAPPTSVERRPLGAADQEGIAKRGPTPTGGPICDRRLTDKRYAHISGAADIALIGKVAIDRNELRELMELYRDNADLCMRLVTTRALAEGLT